VKSVKRVKNKTVKNTKKKCESFCKKDYLIQIDEKAKESSKKYNFPYRPPNKKEKQYNLKVCKKTFCNEKCEGYDFVNPNMKKEFLKNIRNGFQKSYNKNKIEQFKKKGALSSCVDVIDYDVNHKGGSIIYDGNEYTETNERIY